MSEPAISVLMPVKNAEAFIADALKSVLDQTYTDFEVIVIDDGCTDKSIDVVNTFADPRVRVIPGPRSGLADALNAAIAVSRGRYYCNCDADDLFPVDRLTWQMEFLESHPEFDAICSSYVAIDTAGKEISILAKQPECEEITGELNTGKVRTHHATYLVRMEKMRAINGMRRYFVTGLDIDYQLRLSEIGRVWYDTRNGYYYRIHDASITHTEAKLRNDFFQRKAREFQQQRKATGQDDLDRGCAETPPSNSAGHVAPAAKQIQGFLIASPWKTLAEGHRGRAISTAMKAVGADPVAMSGWRNLAIMLVKAPLSSPPRRGA